MDFLKSFDPHMLNNELVSDKLERFRHIPEAMTVKKNLLKGVLYFSFLLVSAYHIAASIRSIQRRSPSSDSKSN